MKHAVPAALLLLFALPGIASAQSLRLVDTAIVEYRGDNENAEEGDDDYGLALNKLYLNGQYEATTVGLQVDASLFSRYPDLGIRSPSSHADDARLERIQVAHRFENATVTLGDAHQQLGRGLVLSLRKVDELGTDQALRGGAVRYDGEGFAANAFGGVVNIANMDGVTQKFLQDPNDLLVGGSATAFIGNAALSVHGIYLQPRTPQSPQFDDDQTVVGGAYLDLPLTDWLSLYAEGAASEARTVGRTVPGKAAYLAADVDLQVVSLLVEGLLLDEFRVWGSNNELLIRQHAYNQPPTLERVDQEVLDNENVRGGRMKVSRGFLDGDLLVYVNGVLRRYGTEQNTTDAVHGYGGFEYSYDLGQSRWYLSGGWRQETRTVDDDPMKTMAHAETDWVQAIGGGWAVHLVVNHEERTLQEVDRKRYRRGSTLVGFDRFGLGSLMAEIGYDTENPQTRDLYLAGIVAWELTHEVLLRGVVGSQRGGLKCIGGICRDFPAFAGARIEASIQHDLL